MAGRVELPIFGSLLLGLGVLACSGPEPTQGGAGAPGVSSCPELAAPSALTVRDGGRVTLELAPEVESFELALPDGFGRDGHTIRAPYGQLGVHAAALTLSCNGQSETRTLAITIEALRWSPLRSWQPGLDGPVGREYFSTWIDSGDTDRLLVFGGFHYQPKQFTPAWDLWSLNLTSETWTALPDMGAPRTPGGRIAAIPDARALLYHGGLDGTSTPPVLRRFDYGPDELTWATLDSPSDPGSYTGAFVHDAARGRYLSVCGASSVLGYHCQVRAWTAESGWTSLDTVGESPSGRAGFFFALDPATDRLVLYGGQGGGPGNDILSDTWALELGETPPRWVPLLPSDAVIGRRNGAYLLDPYGHRLLVWGGTPDGATSVPGLWALELERGSEGWHELSTLSAPPDRTSGMAVLDVARRRMLAGFGNDKSVYADLWALEL
jgi:hypothetical protein